jgi:hypothetical protein
VKILIALRHAGYARCLLSTVQALVERGDDVVFLLGIEPTKKHEGRSLESQTQELESTASELGVTVRGGVEPRRAGDRDLAGGLRSLLDYLRFLEPEFENASKLRARAQAFLPEPLREPAAAAGASPEFRAALIAMTRAVEGMLPLPDSTRELVAEERPDAILVCPMIERLAPQTTYLRAGHELGIPGGVCVASWDNLTTSGLLHGNPNVVTVWNEAQRAEATKLHGVPADRVVATGAPLYDRWFDQEPTSSREEFCRRVGLPDDRPFLLYVCSSSFIAPEEAEWIVSWISGVRESGLAELQDVPVLVRPHPQHRLLDDSPAAVELEGLEGVVIHPSAGSLSLAGTEMPEYYDSIYHSAAVVGINTSAMIEAAVVGRGIHVLLSRRYADTQTGAPHFAHLRTAGGGLINVTKKMRGHAAGLARAIRGNDAKAVEERSERFLAAFIRPNGLDKPATPFMVEQIDRLAEMKLPPVKRVPGPPTDEFDQAIRALEPVLMPPRTKRHHARAKKAKHRR